MYKTMQFDGDAPIYRQLADAIYADIAGGDLSLGDRLPTVRELAETMGLARGTIKRAYEELERMGAVEMTQGRGTFVCYRPAAPQGRKAAAMEAIDEMFRKLGELSFTPAEISIYLDLKMRQFAGREKTMRLTLLDRDPETLWQVAEQLQTLRGVEIRALRLSELTDVSAEWEAGVDLIVTPAQHAQAVARLLPDPEKLERVALTPKPETILALTRLAPGKKIGVLCRTARFAQAAAAVCRTYARADVVGTFLFGMGDLAAFLSGCDVLLLPPDHERLCSEEEAKLLAAATRRHPTIRFASAVDEGSMLHLEQRVQSLLQNGLKA